MTGTEAVPIIVYCHNCHGSVPVPSGIPMFCPECRGHNSFEIVYHRRVGWVNPREKTWMRGSIEESDDDEAEESEPSVEERTAQAGLSGWSA
jgi:hypothetical protein